MNALIIARKEIHQAIRNRLVLSSTLLLAGLALSLTFLGSAPTGTVGVRALDVVIVSLSSLTIFLIPLIALLISHDAIVGDMERGTMLLLLSYPVARWQVLLGILAVDQGRSISASTVDAMLLLNPTDVYRLFNLTGFANVSSFAGMVGLAQSTTLSTQVLLAALLLWTVVPLACAALAFSRREL